MRNRRRGVTSANDPRAARPANLADVPLFYPRLPPPPPARKLPSPASDAPALPGAQGATTTDPASCTGRCHCGRDYLTMPLEPPPSPANGLHPR